MRVTEVSIFDGESELADAVAQVIVDRLRTHRQTEGTHRRFGLVLAGGKTPRTAYGRLALRAPEVDWTKVEILFGDERLVPADHPESNYRMAEESLLGKLNLPPAQVHRVPVDLGAVPAARRYAELVSTRHLDLVLLGLGEDGHTASLFPGGPELAAEGWTAVAEGPKPPNPRITLTLRALASAEEVVFLVSGPTKAKALAQVLEEREEGRAALPAARVAAKRVRFFVDRAAAEALG